MFVTTRIFLILILCSILSGCVRGIKPEVHSINLEESDASSFNHLVLKKRVVLERTKKAQQLQGFDEKSVDEIATSRFGKEHEIANVDCILTSLRDVLKTSNIISATEFWEAIGRDIETLSLASLFDEEYSHAADLLNLDYMVIPYHQRFDVKSVFIENIIEGGYVDEDKEVVSAVTVDMKNKSAIDVIEIDVTYATIIGHITPIPFAVYSYPEEDPCKMAGRLAAEAITQSINFNETPRIAVVAGHWKTAKQNYENELDLRDLQRRARQGDVYAQWNLYDEYSLDENLMWLCSAADSGYARAQKELGRYYWRRNDIANNRSKSYMWYMLAAASNINDGRYREDTIQREARIEVEYKRKNVLTQDQLDKATQLLSAWEPGQCEIDLLGASSENN